MRAVGDAFVAILGLTRNIHIAPARAGGQNYRAGLQGCAVFQLQADIAAGLFGRL